MDRRILRAYRALIKNSCEGYGRGIIALLPSFASDIAQLLRAGDAKGAAASLAEFKNIFGPENVFLELHTTRVLGHEIALCKKIIALARQSGTPLVAQHDVLSQTR